MPELLPYPPGSPDWLAARPALKLTPYSRHGLIHGAYDQARPPLQRHGFARGFLLAREASHA